MSPSRLPPATCAALDTWRLFHPHLQQSNNSLTASYRPSSHRPRAGNSTLLLGPAMLRAAAASLLGSATWAAGARHFAPAAAWAALSGRPLTAQPAPADAPDHQSGAGSGPNEAELAEFREGVRTFAREVVAPHAAEIDSLNGYPPGFEFWRTAGDMGLHGALLGWLGCHGCTKHRIACQWDRAATSPYP